MSKHQIADLAYDTLAGWKADLPVATLMGEFSAGKSTLLNFILGVDVAVTQVTATHMPPTWFSYAKKPFTTGITWDGTEETVDLACTKTNFREDYLVIRRGLNSDALKSCDLIDAPGISDPDLQKDALRFLSRYTDFVVWCTAANQAWRQTENAAFGKLSKSVRAKSLLVITRMDKLRSAKDQAKVLKRVSADAGPHFQCVLPLQTPKAAAIEFEDRTNAADDAWVKTGGHGFMAAFKEACATTKPKGAKAKSKAAAKVAKPKAKEAKNTTKKAKPVDVSADFIARLEQLKTMPENGPHCIQIEQLIASIPCELEGIQIANSTLQECLWIEPDDFDIQRLVSQIGREIGSFGSQDRVRLDA